jgi:hypothetical protein
MSEFVTIDQIVILFEQASGPCILRIEWTVNDLGSRDVFGRLSLRANRELKGRQCDT